MKQGYCKKCGSLGFIEDHHILPKKTFKVNNTETFELCPNCHNEYHIRLGKKNLANPEMEFHFVTFFKWLYGLGIALFLLYLLF